MPGFRKPGYFAGKYKLKQSPYVRNKAASVIARAWLASRNRRRRPFGGYYPMYVAPSSPVHSPPALTYAQKLAITERNRQAFLALRAKRLAITERNRQAFLARKRQGKPFWG